MRVEVTQFVVRSFDLDHLDLFWEIGALTSSAETHEIFDYDFYVLRSGDSPTGPFEQIAGPLRDQYMLRDIQVSLLHKWREYFYKLKVVHRPSGKIKEFGPVSPTPEVDLIGAEVIRQEDMLFREHIGRRCFLFIKRTFGPVCSCLDPVLGRRTRANHLPCFGTGFLGGFMSPIEVFAQIDPAPKVSVATSTQEQQPQDTTGRMISFPPISPGDILVESENKRWRVGPMKPTERLRSPIRQEFNIHSIPRGDVEFALPVNVDLKELKPSAARNFTNPQSLKEPNESYDDLLNFFGRSGGSSR